MNHRIFERTLRPSGIPWGMPVRASFTPLKHSLGVGQRLSRFTRGLAPKSIGSGLLSPKRSRAAHIAFLEGCSGGSRRPVSSFL